MPTYEYRCKTCGKEFEITQKITAESLKKCPVEICENEVKGLGDIERMISKNVNLVFKGTGFYLTDYTNKNVAPSSSVEPQKIDQPKVETTKSENKSITEKSV